MAPRRALVIQTAFLGDVVLATALAERLLDGGYAVDFLLRAGNEPLLRGHPRLRRVLTWEKRHGKLRDWRRLLREIRAARYEVVVNPHRYFATGLWTALSGARHRLGFRQNPLSPRYTYRVEHVMGDGTHEVERNDRLLAPLYAAGELHRGGPPRPRLYPSAEDRAAAAATARPYVTIAPASVWPTKRYPPARWVALIDRLPPGTDVHLLGGPGDAALCREIAAAAARVCHVRAGELSLLASAALMAAAGMNYVNDSSPVHLASAVDAPVRVFFLSTAPALGFGPLSTDGAVREITEPLACRPCGKTGRRACPLGHFACSAIEPRID